MTLTITKANGIEIAWESFGNPGDETFLLISGLGTQMIRWTAGFCEGLAARGYRGIRFRLLHAFHQLCRAGFRRTGVHADGRRPTRRALQA